MTDNKDLYIDYLTEQGCPVTIEEARDSDTYFVIELVRRNKDNPDLSKANMHFKNYYVTSIEKFIRIYDEIKSICDLLRLRAYFSVNAKSAKQILLDTVAEGARRIASHDFRKPWAIYESYDGKYCDRSQRKWVMDLDDCNMESSIVKFFEETIQKIPPYNTIICKVPTKSGVHLITKPFNRQELLAICKKEGIQVPTIQENHLSLLYENL